MTQGYDGWLFLSYKKLAFSTLYQFYRRFPEVAEIHLEGWIGDDIVELLQRQALFVLRAKQGVTLNDVRDGVNEVVEDQVQAQQA